MIEQSEIVIGDLRGIGVEVLARHREAKKHFKTAIIDNRILWDGSLNILSYKDTEEHMCRYEGVSAVEQVKRNLELNYDKAVGNIKDEHCPNCSEPMVIRKSK
jgi:4-hydroxy-L-threonine phosphate dehydrogenase PdxA